MSNCCFLLKYEEKKIVFNQQVTLPKYVLIVMALLKMSDSFRP